MLESVQDSFIDGAGSLDIFVRLWLQLAAVEERMRKSLGGGEAFFVVYLETLAYQVLRLVANELEFRMVEVVLAVDNFMKYLVAAETLEG